MFNNSSSGLVTGESVVLHTKREVFFIVLQTDNRTHLQPEKKESSQ